MANTMTIEEMSKVIDILKSITKNDEEAMQVFKDNDLDFEKVTIVVEDVILGLQEVHQALYKHDTKQINIKNLTECKDYYYETGYKELEEDSFVEATYRMVDITFGNDDMGHVREIALVVFGESFNDLYTTKARVKSELSNFIYDTDLIEKYVSVFAELDDLNYLLNMTDEYTLKLVKLHQYYYQYDDSKFTTISGDAIGILCESYYDNRSQTDLLKRMGFMQAIDFLLEVIDKAILPRTNIINLIDMLFDNDDDDHGYFEGLTNFGFNYDVEITNDEIRGINKYVALQDEYYSFHESVNQFSLKLDDMLACGEYYRESELDLLHKIQDLFDKMVKL